LALGLALWRSLRLWSGVQLELRAAKSLRAKIRDSQNITRRSELQASVSNSEFRPKRKFLFKNWRNKMVNYAVSDMITRIRNGIRGKKARVSIYQTQMTKALAQILVQEGFVQEIETSSNEGKLQSLSSSSFQSQKGSAVAMAEPTPMQAPKLTGSSQKEKFAQTFDIVLAYKGRGPQTRSVLTSIKCVSRPGVRVYSNSRRIPQVLGGLGQTILSTSKGILTDTQARKLGIGGEVLCLVW
jgi:small subunit ribosomal protein S8